MLIFSIFILQAISASLCFDLELEAVMKVGQDFLRILKQRSAFGNKMQLPIPLSFASKGKLPQKEALTAAVMRAVAEPNNTKAKIEQFRPLQDYVNLLKKKGTRRLNDIGKLIQKDFNLNEDVTSLIQTVTDDYNNMMQNYYDFVTEGPVKTDIDKEFVYLDIVETSCRLMYSEERKLLNDIIVNHHYTSINNSIKTMSENIYKVSVNRKREEMQYICTTFKVCRTYPAFTDYCADLISEVLRLQDKKFRSFLDLLARIIQMNDVFFETIAEHEDRHLMKSKLQSFSHDIFGMKEFFAVLRAVITQRFKTVQSSNVNLVARTTAMRILLDIIDKALSFEEDLLTSDFLTSMTALRNWSVGIRESIDDIFEKFGKHLLRAMAFNLNKTARKEIPVLIEIIMRGQTEKKEIYQRLFKYGSMYVKGENVHAVVESAGAF